MKEKKRKGGAEKTIPFRPQIKRANYGINKGVRAVIVSISPNEPNYFTIASMTRYHFSVTINHVRIKVHINAKNQMSAYGKAKRLYPMATSIHLIRSERLWNRDMY